MAPLAFPMAPAGPGTSDSYWIGDRLSVNEMHNLCLTAPGPPVQSCEARARCARASHLLVAHHNQVWGSVALLKYGYLPASTSSTAIARRDPGGTWGEQCVEYGNEGIRHVVMWLPRYPCYRAKAENELDQTMGTQLDLESAE